MIFLYRVMQDIERIDRKSLVEEHDGRETRGHRFKLAKQHSRINVRRESYGLRMVDGWNAMGKDVIEFTS
jgi:hypothetical protein